MHLKDKPPSEAGRNKVLFFNYFLHFRMFVLFRGEREEAIGERRKWCREIFLKKWSEHKDGKRTVFDSDFPFFPLGGGGIFIQDLALKKRLGKCGKYALRTYTRREEDLKQGRRPPFSQIQKRGMYSRQLRSHFMASLDGDWGEKKRKRAFVPLVERAVGSMSRWRVSWNRFEKAQLFYEVARIFVELYSHFHKIWLLFSECFAPWNRPRIDAQTPN